MKKFLTSAVAVAILAAGFVPVAQATDVTSSFTVSVALVAKCTANNSGALTLDFGSYTAFGSAVNATPIDLTFDCTRGLTAPTFAFDTAGGSATGYGVLAGLNYKLSAANGTNVTTGSGATAVSGGVGTADTRKVTVSGVMDAGQAGTCSATAAGCSTAVTATRVLTVTY